MRDILQCDNNSTYTYTFDSEAHNSTSWLDHVLTTASGNAIIKDNACRV